jgi:hypothetical protein
MVDASTLRIVWLNLLPQAATQYLGALGGVCKYDSGWPWRPFFAGLDLFANTADAMWVSWKHRTYAGFPVANHTWIEVTHCAQGRRKVGVPGAGWQFGPMWSYVAPGSGVSINVGRSVIMTHEGAMRLLKRVVYPDALECACSAGCAWGRHNGTRVVNASESRCWFGTRRLPPAIAATEAVQLAEAAAWHAHGDADRWSKMRAALHGALPRSQRCWSFDDVADQIDTIQIIDHEETLYSHEKRHEIVHLRHDGECARLEPSTPHLMCGRWPRLRKCEAGSPALARVNKCVLGRLRDGAPLTSTAVIRAVNYTARRCSMTWPVA